MYSLLANANYEYKEMKLADLRNRIIEENQLTPLSILKGFHTKSNIHPKYEVSNDADDFRVVEELHADIIKQIPAWTALIQKTYDTLFNEDFDKLKAVVPDATIELLNAGEYSDRDKYDVSIRNIEWEMIHHLQYENVLSDTLATAVTEFVSNWLAEHYPEYTIEDKKWSQLPSYLELNKELDVDFDNTYKSVHSQYGSILGGLDSVEITFDSHLRLISSIKTFRVPELYKHLERTDAETIFNTAIDSIIYNNNKMGTLAYFQNLEAQPITININTKTGRVELIDGYKRLLYIANQTLLDYSAPIRVFTDLDDIGFLSLLYAANLWKYTAKNRDIAFHDRGYLFALKTRYGFEIPEIAYKHYSNIRYYSDILAVFYAYDFDGDYYKYTFSDDQMSIMDALRHHKHTIKDLIVILNTLPQESSRDLQYDKNIADEIENFIIRTLGHIRRLPNSDEQKDLDQSVLTKIFNDELIVKECCKKHLSTDTYVKNHLENKKLYNRIIEILLNSLT